MNFVEDLISQGGEIYLVGGAIRNLLYNQCFDNKIKIKDKDILVCKISNEVLIKILQKYGTVKLVGVSFGVIKFRSSVDRQEYDIALPRKEISTGPGYRDFIIETNDKISITEDFERRDATINAIGKRINVYDDLNNENVIFSELIDPYNGCEDIKNKKWRAIGDPLKRFYEDPIRILRAFRQCAELHFEIEGNTLSCIKNNLSLLSGINSNSRVRIMDELFRILKTDCYHILLEMKKIGLLNTLNVPNVVNDHNIQLFDNLPSKINMKIRLALLLYSHANNSCFNWCKYNNIGSSLYFSKNWLNFIECVHNYYNILDKVTNDYDMRVLLQSIENKYKNYGKEYLIDLNSYYQLINFDKEKNYLLKNNIDFPLSINDIEINGNELMTLFNLNGVEIKNTKLHLLDKINKNELDNNNNDIIQYLKVLNS